MLIKIKSYIKLLRPKHWLKNFLIFLPLVFSFNFFNINFLKINIMGFISFCLLSSSIYILNDIYDVEKDRLHSLKKNRPIANGSVKIWEATIILITLFVFSLIIISIFSINKIAILIPIIYFIINFLYSKFLKNIPILDITILMLGFVLRVFLGSYIINVPVSSWLYLTIISFSFYLGLGKRRNELIKNGTKGRKVLEYYNKDFLNKNMYMFLTLTIAFYSLWCVDPANVLLDYAKFSIPIVMIIVMRYSLIIEGDSYGDPVDVVLNDKTLIFLVLSYLIYIGISILLIFYKVNLL